MTPADEGDSTRAGRKRCLWFVVKLLVPIVLLWIIFRQVDVGVLCEHFRHARPVYFLAGMVGGVMSQVLVAAYRWKYMLEGGCSVRLPYGFLLRKHWTGMFLGYFVPAGLGVDAYRIGAVYSRAGKLGANVAVIIGERLAGVAGSVVVVLATYPMVVSQMECSANLIDVMGWVYLVGMGTVAAAITSYVLGRAWWAGHGDCLAGFVSMANRMASRLAARVERRLGEGRSRSESVEPEERAPPNGRLPSLHYVGVVMLLTVLIRVLAAVAVYCFFLSLGHEVSFTVAIFAFSVIFLVFMLPISFGSLGVREGAYIVFFGLFAVPREVALAASFLGLAALLTTISVGGLILLGSVLFADKEQAA